MKVGFAGMGHMGLVNAAVATEHGHTVYAWDPDPAFVIQLKERSQGEPGVVTSLEAAPIQWSENIRSLASCEAVYITVDVDEHEPIELLALRDLIDKVAHVIKDDVPLIIMSQVPPGFTRSLGCLPKHRLFCQVDTLVFGQAMDRARSAHQVTIGCADMSLAAAKVMRQLEELVAPSELYLTTYENAELGKMAVNCYLAAAISMSNTLAMIAPTVKADWEQVQGVLSGDPRVGTYTQPGLGIGGGHLMRDVRSMTRLVNRRQMNVELLEAIANVDGHMKYNWATDELFRAGLDPRKDPIAIWGLTYKVGTTSTRASPGLTFMLGTTFEKVRVHDPEIDPHNDPHFAGLNYERFASGGQAAEGASAILVACPWIDYAGYNLKAVREAMKKDLAVMLDPYRLFSRARVEEAGFRYITLGA